MFLKYPIVLFFILVQSAFANSYEVPKYINPKIGEKLYSLRKKSGSDFCNTITKELVNAYLLVKAHSKPRCSEIKFSNQWGRAFDMKSSSNRWDTYFSPEKRDDIQFQVDWWRHIKNISKKMSVVIEKCKNWERIEPSSYKEDFKIILKNKKDQEDFMTGGTPKKSKKLKKKTK